MKYAKYIIPALAIMLAASCDMDKKANGQDDNTSQQQAPKEYKSPAEAAMAAKEDMLAAIDKVNFGVSRDALKNATPGAPVMKYGIDWDALVRADSNITPENMTQPEPVTMVPLINGTDVVTMVALNNRNQQYTVAALGDKQIAEELDMVRKADSAGMQSEIKIFEVPNLQAVVYAVGSPRGNIYYTSYNNNSIRRGMNGAELFKMLKNDAVLFQRQFGEELKKGKLVK